MLKVGCVTEDKGGVAGGSILQGVLKVGGVTGKGVWWGEHPIGAAEGVAGEG